MPDPWKGQKNDKLVFVGLCPDYLSLRTSAHAGVAIPRLERKCTEKRPKMGAPAIFGGYRYLVPFNGGIATTSVRYALAMTAFFQTRCVSTVGADSIRPKRSCF